MQRGVSIITGRMADDLPNLGIDLGGSKILAAVVASDGSVLGRAKAKTRPEKGYAAVPALERAARALGWGLSAVRAVVDPERYVLGGGVLEELGADLQPLIAEAMAEHAFFHRRTPADLRMGELGGDAVVVGAAVAAAVAPREVVG